MAHRLNQKEDGTHAFVAVGEKAWHGLGNYVDKAMTADEAIVLGGLDWEVKKRKISVAGGKVIPGVMATVREDTKMPLGIVSDKYNVVQNRECFGFMDSIIDKGEAMFQTAGVLDDGQRIFITCKLPDDILVHGEKIEKYLLLSAGHDGKNTIQIGFTTTRVVCWNTLTAALKDGLQNKLTILHYANAQDKLKQAAKIMGMSSLYATQLSQDFNKMAGVKISDLKLKEYVENVMKSEQISKEELEADYKPSKLFVNKVTGILEFAHEHATQNTDATKGTVFGAYNAVSGYFGHLKNYINQEEKMKDIYYGQAGNKIEKAYEYAMALVPR